MFRLQLQLKKWSPPENAMNFSTRQQFNLVFGHNMQSALSHRIDKFHFINTLPLSHILSSAHHTTREDRREFLKVHFSLDTLPPSHSQIFQLRASRVIKMFFATLTKTEAVFSASLIDLMWIYVRERVPSRVDGVFKWQINSAHNFKGFFACNP